MKSNKYQARFYRDWVKPDDLCVTKVAVKETDLQILTDKPADMDFVKQRIIFYRGQIEDYISKDNRFLTNLKPIAVELGAPRIVKQMCAASKKANVGPMAAVAGAIAHNLGRDLLRAGFGEVIIENGGDIFLKVKKYRKVGIYPGKSALLRNLKLNISPQDTPLGICTSSATLGHSLSFGCADSVIVLSKNTALADAAATAVCNCTRSKNNLKECLDFASSIRGVIGAVIILNNDFAVIGRVEFEV